MVSKSAVIYGFPIEGTISVVDTANAYHAAITGTTHVVSIINETTLSEVQYCEKRF